MNLFAGLEKFGFSGMGDVDILEEESQGNKRQAAKQVKKVEKPVEEKDLVLSKTVTCPVCDNKFHTLVVKTGKVRSQESDFDLRPIPTIIDKTKYDACACPHCGYAALNSTFMSLIPAQMKLVRNEIGSKFRSIKDQEYETYTYEQAVDRFKLALVSTMVKRGKLSEKSYTCLKIAWLYREMLKTAPEGTEEEKAKKAQMKAEYDEFYRQAYEGFIKASSTEMPPFVGSIDSNTMDFMLANMSVYFGEYETASKLVARLLSNQNLPSRVKDKCVDLKQKIIEDVKKQNAAQKQQQ